MKVRVTQAHIRKGDPGSADSCPIALAIKMATGYEVTVFDEIIVICPPYCEPTPREVFDKLEYFDNTGEMEPFDFEIKDFPC